MWTISDKEQHISLNGWPVSELILAATIFLTILGLLINSYFAARSRKEASRANMLAHLPIVSIKFKGDDIAVYNLGTGFATDVKVDTYYHSFYDDLFTHKYGTAVIK